jgi:hypothetical protein
MKFLSFRSMVASCCTILLTVPAIPAADVTITNSQLSTDSIILAGFGGSSNQYYYVLTSTNLGLAATNWPAIGTNLFDNAGTFTCTSAITPGLDAAYFILRTGGQAVPPAVGPSITGQPQNQTVVAGQTATFTVTADGTDPLSCQWYFNTNTVLNGATNFSLAVTNAQPDDAGMYSVTVTNVAGSATSAYASLNVLVPPSISAQPQSLTVTQGQTATFTVTATGTAPLSYRWYFNTNTALSGATNASFTLSSAQSTNAGTYSVIITNLAGSVTSSNATLTVLVPPSISSQPQSQTVGQGANANFSVTAGGTAPLSYQWYFNTNTALTAATNTSLSITNAQSTNAGIYSVVITNVAGSLTSAYATLTVGVDTNGAYFVATNGLDTYPGTITQPFKTISKGLTTIGANGLLYIRGGIYTNASKLTLSQTGNPTNRIRIWGYPGERPIVDATGNGSDSISISGSAYHLKNFDVRYAGHNAIVISGNSNIVEYCGVYSNKNTGLHITGGSSGSTYPRYNVITNCDAIRNYDASGHGQDADGFSAKWNLGVGNTFSGCRAWENSDDGWDLWMGITNVVITNCWAFRNGTNVFGDTAWEGNGNGFKLGGNYTPAPHRLVRCAAFVNMANGIDQNNNTTGLTVDNNISYKNVKANFNLNHNTTNAPITGYHVVRNNVTLSGGSGDAFTSGSTLQSNSWQVITSPAVSTSDLISVDVSLAYGPRQSDGSLPAIDLLHPVAPGGRLLDKGIIISGDVYYGTAPDLGAFEYVP